jgi:DNA repair protein RecO (recombination protein O)
MERISAEAVVLSSVDYGDADKLVTFFTRELGRLTAFAAGARKSKRRFAGALDPGTRLRAQLVERRGDTLRLDNVDVLASYHHVREELPLIARALYALELIRELTRDRQPHHALFDALATYLQSLDEKRAGPTSLLAFELEALDEAGLRPSFSPCALCEGPVSAQPRFAPDHGGVVCGSCAFQASGALPVWPQVVQALHQLQGGARVPLPADIRLQARRLLNVFIDHHVGKRLKSVDFMEQVGTD